MVCYFKRICGINQAEDRVTWPDLLHRHTIALVSFREWSVVSARLRIRAQPRNPCRARNSASAWTWWMILEVVQVQPESFNLSQYHIQYCSDWSKIWTNPADTPWKNHIIMTLKQCRFDVIMTIVMCARWESLSSQNTPHTLPLRASYGVSCDYLLKNWPCYNSATSYFHCLYLDDDFFQVKNKMPAPVQITAEQLLREAKERELELVQPVSWRKCLNSLAPWRYE